MVLETGSAVKLGSCCFYFLLPTAMLKPNKSYFWLCFEELKASAAALSVSELADKIKQRCAAMRAGKCCAVVLARVWGWALRG